MKQESSWHSLSDPTIIQWRERSVAIVLSRSRPTSVPRQAILFQQRCYFTRRSSLALGMAAMRDNFGGSFYAPISIIDFPPLKRLPPYVVWHKVFPDFAQAQYCRWFPCGFTTSDEMIKSKCLVIFAVFRSQDRTQISHKCKDSRNESCRFTAQVLGFLSEKNTQYYTHCQDVFWVDMCFCVFLLFNAILVRCIPLFRRLRLVRKLERG